MRKAEVRNLKSHYQSRWAVLRHNQKSKSKMLLLNDAFVLKNLQPGNTLCYNCLGEMYKDIIDDLSVDEATCDNLVLINNLAFKYKTVTELSAYIQRLSVEFLRSGGRLIFSFEHRFLIYDRVNVSIDTMITNLTNQFQGFELVKFVNLLNCSQPGYGDYFFCFEKL